MKYLIEILRKDDVGMLQVKVFSDHVVHSDMVCQLKHADIVGAGFCGFNAVGVLVVYGRSESLRIGPHKSDVVVLTAFFDGSFDSMKILLSELYEEET